MQISSDLLVQIMGAVNFLTLVVVALAPVLVYVFVRKHGCPCWTYFFLALPLSVVVVLGTMWFDDYSTGLLLTYYGYNEGLVNEYANVLPENMETVDRLLERSHDCHVSDGGIFLTLYLSIDAVYCVVSYFLLNLVTNLFGGVNRCS
ncbi:MAG: hypothetical protein II623_10010 [Paludibacteraceae bacterium]|nr:hypothetical protein [Paludibacteraceae bacterium]MBR6042596.1 hypothetical protein [Paludibacteraceae bacterium]